MTRMDGWCRAVFVTVMVAGPMGVGAQTPEDQIQVALDRALEAGIPLSLLESKVAEGRAKGVPMDRIAAAVDQRLDALARASAAMGASTDDVDAGQLSVGADALGAGVSEAVLAEISSTAPGEQRTVAIAALTYLVGQGIAPEAALLRVQEALARGPEGLANEPGIAGPPSGVPAGGPGGGPPDGRGGGPPSSIPAPGRGGPPESPGGGGPPNVPGGGPPGRGG